MRAVCAVVVVGGALATLGATAGMNTLVCKVRDRGSMSHFDACVVGQERTQEMPEFPSSAVPLIILTIVPAMAFVMVGRKK